MPMKFELGERVLDLFGSEKYIMEEADIVEIKPRGRQPNKIWWRSRGE